MGIGRQLAATTTLVALSLGVAGGVRATPFEELSGGRRAMYTAGAVAANTLPGASALADSRCLPGYILCKATFAAFSLIAAGESLVMSGGSDLAQPRALLYRGFSGDWVATPRDIAGDTKVELLPEAPPPADGGKKSDEFVPPPL